MLASHACNNCENCESNIDGSLNQLSGLSREKKKLEMMRDKVSPRELLLSYEVNESNQNHCA